MIRYNGIDLEEWVINLLKSITKAKYRNFDEFKITLNKEQINLITDAYEKIDYVEIY